MLSIQSRLMRIIPELLSSRLKRTGTFDFVLTDYIDFDYFKVKRNHVRNDQLDSLLQEVEYEIADIRCLSVKSEDQNSINKILYYFKRFNISYRNYNIEVEDPIKSLTRNMRIRRAERSQNISAATIEVTFSHIADFKIIYLISILLQRLYGDRNVQMYLMHKDTRYNGLSESNVIHISAAVRKEQARFTNRSVFFHPEDVLKFDFESSMELFEKKYKNEHPSEEKHNVIEMPKEKSDGKIMYYRSAAQSRKIRNIVMKNRGIDTSNDESMEANSEKDIENNQAQGLDEQNDGSWYQYDHSLDYGFEDDGDDSNWKYYSDNLDLDQQSQEFWDQF